jgi:hypothetical protein
MTVSMVFSMSQTMPKNGKIRHNRQTLFLCCCTTKQYHSSKDFAAEEKFHFFFTSSLRFVLNDRSSIL